MAYLRPEEDFYSVMPQQPGLLGEESPEALSEELQAQIVIEPIGPPAKPPTYLYKAAKDWCPQFFNAGKQYIDRKRQAWDRLKYMFVNQLPLSFWNKTKSEIDDYLSRSDLSFDDEQPLRKRNDETISIAQYVLHFAEGAFQAVFQAEPWFSVTAEAEIDKPSTEDLSFSTAQKMENYLGRVMRKAFFKEHAYQVFQWLALLGSCGGQVRWWEKRVVQNFSLTKIRPDGNAIGKTEVFQEEKIVFAEPCFDVLPPDQVFVDPSARTSNVQKWYGIGTCSEITRAEAIGLFETKVFTLNEKAFKERWGEPGSASGSDTITEDVAYDTERGDLDEAIDNLRLWQYHGLIPTKKGDIESVAVWITEKGAENCDSGIIVKLHEGTALHYGLRPFVWANYTPWQGPYGLGSVEPHFSKIWIISHLQNLLTDCLELIVNPQWQIVDNSRAHLSLQEKDGDINYPGKKFIVGQIDKEIKSYPAPEVNIGALSMHLQQLRGEFQMETGVDDNTLGVGNREKTASEVNYMSQQAAGPLSVRLEMLGETFLDPTLTLFLHTIQQYELSDQVISVIDGQGIPATVMITAEELKTGKYSVQSIITSEDTNRLGIINSLQQILPNLMDYKQMVNSEGFDLKVTPVIREYFGRTRIPRINQVIQPLPPPPPEQEEMPMEGGPLPGQGAEAPPGPMPPQSPSNPTDLTGGYGDGRGPIGDGSDTDNLAKIHQDLMSPVQGGPVI